MIAAAFTVWLALVAGPDAAEPIAAIGGVAVAVLVATLAVARPEGIVAALALLGGAYVVILVLDDPPLDVRSAVVGATLLTIGELSHLSVGARAAVTAESDTVARRLGFVVVLATIALGLGVAILAVVDLLRTGGLAVEVVGVAAAAAVVGLLVLAARTAYD